MTDLRVIGVGSPLVDILIRVDEDFMETIEGEKGGMLLVENEVIEEVLSRYGRPHEQAPGGSAANTIRGIARLGVPCGFVGKVGQDGAAAYLEQAFNQLGVTPLLKRGKAGTGRVLSLITPDGQRTMRTYLGASQELSPTDISSHEFMGCQIVHVEGYLLFNRELIMAVLQGAKEAGAKISLDLASFEVVTASRDILPDILHDYVDFVFANEDEAIAFSGKTELDSLAELAGLCEIAVVKVGEEGAYLRRGEILHKVAACEAKVIDTTGAGDFWASGFLYGLINGYDLPQCGYLGSLLASKVIENIGAFITEEGWAEIRSIVANLRPQGFSD